ncbi:HPP family protein [Motiliproteus coralliicola]|uniref:HPP family protein n=1 Tax=Motiliproteus coralliicola TaxID=2283196 RepID=A0A369WU73_9GAMM|nr:HPP family protein [Motiliproteus coralliicola]
MGSWRARFAGDKSALPPRAAPRQILMAGLGGFVMMLVLAGLAENLGLALVLGSFGASCVLVFGFPDAPFSQPRNIVAGHFLSSLIGLACLTLFGPQVWSLGLAVGLAIALMMLTRTVHPPAGSNPVIVFLMLPGWEFLLLPTLLGALLIVAVALVYNNLCRGLSYPKYW